MGSFIINGQKMKEVKLPISKSLYIRKLIIDFLYNNQIGIASVDMPADVRIVADCLAIIGSTRNADFFVPIDVHDCGAAYRFLMAVLAVTPGKWKLTGTERLLQRPINELADCLVAAGAKIKKCHDGWLVEGRNLSVPELTIDCHRSSQFASALLLIGNKINLQQLNILPEDPPSAYYISMTSALLDDQSQQYLHHCADWSAAVYWYARLALEKQGSYLLLDLTLDSLQHDAVLADWFTNLGVCSQQTEHGVLIEYLAENNTQSSDFVIDVHQNLDLVPVMACMACLQSRTFIFNGIANLRHKESDRLQMIAKQLMDFTDIKINRYQDINDNQLIIKQKSPSSTKDRLIFDACNDHRFVMGFSLFALFHDVSIKDFNSVRKSYPNFKI